MKAPTMLDGAPAIRIVEYSKTVGAIAASAATNPEITTTTPAGFTPIGVVGCWFTATTGATYFTIGYQYLAGTTIKASFRNRSSSSSSSSDTKIHFQVAYLKVS